MKCLMPLNQREAIAREIRGRSYVEWGVGGTTLWLASEATPRIAISIEHDEQWQCNVDPLLPESWSSCCVACVVGANATPGEEESQDAACYVNAGASLVADVYLIDGVVRAKCLQALIATGRPMTVFIHDTQRDWYDGAIAEAVAAGFKRTDYPEGYDYPGCLLTKLER